MSGTRQPEDVSAAVPLSDAQRRKIWVTARRELGWDALRLHEWLHATVGTRHVHELSRESARKVIDRLELLLGRKPNRGYRERGLGVDEAGEMVQYATPAELAKLRALGRRIDKGDDYLCRVAIGVLNRHVGKLADLHSSEIHLLVNVVGKSVALAEQRRRQESLFEDKDEGGRMKAEPEDQDEWF